MADRHVLALAGLSGAGKTTLIAAVRDQCAISHFSASDLIKEQINLERNEPKTSEDLRVGDVAGNQDRLSLAFRRTAAEVQGDIILDCHTLIDTPSGLLEISASVFESVGVTDFAFLMVEPRELHHRRTMDSTRSRPSRTLSELEYQQQRALDVTRTIASSLAVPFHVVSAAPVEALITIVKDFSGDAR